MIRFAAAALVAFAACQFSEDRHVRRPIAAPELVGEWHATAEAMDALREEGHTKYLSKADHRLRLKTDGTCEAKTLMGTAVQSRYVDVTGACQWRLQRTGRRQYVLLTVAGSAITYGIAEEEGRLFLWQPVGDPDAWRYMEFTR